MNFEEEMEKLQDEVICSWENYQKLMDKKQDLVDSNLGSCPFCGEEIHVSKDCYRKTWEIHCEDCSASTPPAKTFAQAVRYWRALENAKEVE